MWPKASGRDDGDGGFGLVLHERGGEGIESRRNEEEREEEGAQSWCVACGYWRRGGGGALCLLCSLHILYNIYCKQSAPPNCTYVQPKDCLVCSETFFLRFLSFSPSGKMEKRRVERESAIADARSWRGEEEKTLLKTGVKACHFNWGKARGHARGEEKRKGKWETVELSDRL